MRKLFKMPLSIILLSLLLSTACEKDNNKLELGVSPLKFEVYNDEIIMTQNNEEEVALSFGWDDSKIDASDRENLVYYLQWDIKGNKFRGANQKQITKEGNKFTFSVKELNALLSPVYGSGKEVDLELRLYVANPEGSAADSYYSAKQDFKVKTYRTNYIVISGFLPNPTGTDSPTQGAVLNSSTGLKHGGGYEYIQLLALEDIDFSKTPYSVVTCNNGTVQANGWATGGSQTFKFDLTEGFAKKGTYFYVGGSAKVINGYASSKFSTDISSANWIRSIFLNIGDPTALVGDGFGNSSEGILGNDNGTTGNADGIAVFYGTEVTKSTVPIDVIFFGAIPGASTYLSASGYGYRIGNTDWYSIFESSTGVSQPFFNIGSNKTIAIGSATQGTFYKLAGAINSNGEWISPRLSNNTVILTQSSKIAVIEDGASSLVD